jgi:RimJ/RimL family protein N-acetyltransferase
MSSLRSLGRQPRPIASGLGIELRYWDRALVDQIARWGTHGFPYSAFDMNYLRDRNRAKSTLERMRDRSQHLHFVACEEGAAVGRLSVNMLDRSGLYIWAVHVPPEHEGRAVARRMLAVLLSYLEAERPGRDFTLTSNAFATRAHRAYRYLGFEAVETRWQFDRELAQDLLRLPPEAREPVAQDVRFVFGRWEVKTLVFRRKAGADIPWRELQPRQSALVTP